MNKNTKRFFIYLLKPSHYDDDGYPIIWAKTLIPSNSLATVYGLCMDAVDRRIFGVDVQVDVIVVDETNTRIVPARIARQIERENARGFICMVGVQTNQFPRTMDLARKFVACGLPVCVGGFHVAGHLATMGQLPEEALAAQQEGVSFFAGEGEGGRVAEVLIDAYRENLKPLYNFLGEQPDVGNEPVPQLPPEELARTQGNYTAFDLGRGCPFNCSFCTIINVHGHKSRFRTPDDLELIIRKNHAMGVHRYFLTDDNIARNKNWESFFDRLIALRKEGIRIRILAQVDTASYKIPRLIEKAIAAGVDQLFIGMESINPENLAAVNKKQNKTETYQQALRAWKRFPVVITAAYIVGLPGDTPQTVARDIDVIKRELPIDTIYFTNLTPLPGSMDHKHMKEAGQWMSDDLNAYDTHHCVSRHARMSADEWKMANRNAWRSFYSKEHMLTVLRRMVAQKSDKKLTTINRLALYSYFGCHTSIHPIDGGLVRKKYRRDRRPGYKCESAVTFYPRYVAEVVHDTVSILNRFYFLWRNYKKIIKDPNRFDYSDVAIGEK